MFQWRVDFKPNSERDLNNLSIDTRRRVIEKIEWLSQNFEDIFPSVLSNEFRNFFKLRVGDFRVIYQADWSAKTLTIYYIDRRDKIYKKKR